MNLHARIKDADPRQLARLLEDALRWLNEEWFSAWLDDEAADDLAADLDVDTRRQLQRLGTPYLKERLDEVAKLVRDMTRGLDACLKHPGEAAARWATAHRRPLSYVVDLYELAASRNAAGARHPGTCRLGDAGARPGVERDRRGAMALLYEGLGAPGGRAGARARGRHAGALAGHGAARRGSRPARVGGPRAARGPDWPQATVGEADNAHRPAARGAPGRAAVPGAAEAQGVPAGCARAPGAGRGAGGAPDRLSARASGDEMVCRDEAGRTWTEVVQLVFTTARGEPVTRSRFGEAWRQAVEDAGLPASTTYHDPRPSSLLRLVADRPRREREGRAAPGSATPRRPRRWTRTRTCGRTPRTAHGSRSTRCWAAPADSLRTGEASS